MTKYSLITAIFLAGMVTTATAEGVMKVGGFIGTHPKDFTYRFNALRSDAPKLFPSVLITAKKGTDVQDLGSGVTLSVKKNSYGDGLENVQVTCADIRTEQRVKACTLAFLFTALSIDDQIKNRDFLKSFESAVEHGSAKFNDADVNYFMKADTKRKTMSLRAEIDGATQVANLPDDPPESRSPTCNPAVTLCIKP